jgi:hypothetical protein
MDRTTETEALKSPDELCFRMRKSLGRGFPPHPALVEFPSQKMGIRRGLDVSWCLATSRAIFPFFPLDGILIYAYHPLTTHFCLFPHFPFSTCCCFPAFDGSIREKKFACAFAFTCSTPLGWIFRFSRFFFRALRFSTRLGPRRVSGKESTMARRRQELSKRKMVKIWSPLMASG